MALNGSFSNTPVTGSQFGLICEWAGIQSTSALTTTVTLKVYLSYYNLQVSARDDCNATIGTNSETFSTEAINDYSSGWKKKLIKTKTVNIVHAADGTANDILLSASWRYGGTYNGQYVGVITASTTVDLDAINQSSRIVSVANCIVDDQNPVVTATITAYGDNYTHKFYATGTNGLLYPFDEFVLSRGTSTVTLQVSESAKQQMLNEIGTNTRADVNYKLLTYYNDEKLGTTQTYQGVISLTERNSSPILTDFSFVDTNSQMVNITGDNTVIVQSKSNVRITVVPATPQNGATIVKYQATIGNITKESTTNVINFGSVNTYGENIIVVTAVDSRGFTKSLTKNVNITRYQGDASLTSWEIRRLNGVGEEVDIALEGEYSPIFTNSIISCSYTYREVDGTEEEGGSFAVTSSSGRFSYSGRLSQQFDSNKAYIIKVTVNDKISSDSEEIPLQRGTPQVQFRKGYVNVNDLLKVKGHSIGFVKELTDDIHLHLIKDGGIYSRTTPPPASMGYPSGLQGVLTVTTADGIKTLEYHDVANNLYITNCYAETWQDWKLIEYGGGGSTELGTLYALSRDGNIITLAGSNGTRYNVNIFTEQDIQAMIPTIREALRTYNGELEEEVTTYSGEVEVV